MFHILVLFFILLAAIVARLLHTLSNSGTIAAFLVGALIYLGFGSSGLSILGVFFGTSSYLSYYKKQQKHQMEEKLEKGSRRDWLQVFANGGIAAVCGLIYYVTNDKIWVMAFLTSLACATGDTWSSEIGPLSKTRPISVKSFRYVSAGTSGAISALGTVSAMLGVLLITLIGVSLFSISVKMACFILLFGILGNGVDTYLGAYVQRRYQCIICSLEIEKTVHCGKRAKKIGGFSLLTNDGVNFFATFISPLFAILIYQLL
jgi:uncharacterized protein (TIGR00297 family)